MKKLLGSIIVLAAIAYVAYPYLTLARIDRALRERDAAELEVLFDWPALRASVKSDAKAIALSPSSFSALGGGGLEAAGAALGSMLGAAMIDNVIDSMLSPAGIVRMSQDRLDDLNTLQLVRYAFFASPTTFRVDLRRPDVEQKLTVSALMTFSGLSWRVDRIILPVAAYDEWKRANSGGGRAP